MVVPDPVPAPMHDGAGRQDGDGSVGLEHRELHLLQVGDAMLADGHLHLLLVHAFAAHHVGQVLAVPHDNRRRGGEETVKARQVVELADQEVQGHEGDDQDEPATQRRVRSRDRRLQRVGDQEDEDEVEERELPDLSLAKQAQGDQKRAIDQRCTQDKLPRRDAWQERD